MKKLLILLLFTYSVLAITSCDIFGGSSSLDSTDTFPDKEQQNDDYLTNDIIPDYISLYSKWGLGSELSIYKHNDRDYAWYIDQKNTGIFSNINCGPTAVTMSIKWAEETFSETPAYARSKYKSSGGWWSTLDIIAFLEDFGVSNNTIMLSDMSDLKAAIDNDFIAILCLDMYYIPYNSEPEFHIDGFFDSNKVGSGHFIVIKGYMVVDQFLWFEVYDPASWSQKYSDETLKGKNRYYSAEDINQATNEWWDYAVIILKDTAKWVDHDYSYKFVDPNMIEHMTGK